MAAVGVDGGGTKTRVVVFDLDRKQLCATLAEKLGESSNTKSIGEEKGNENLKSTIEAALAAAGKTCAEVTAICLGMAGVDRPADRAALEKFVRSFLTNKDLLLSIENDGIVALASGTGGNLSGIVVISGTGTITYGVNGTERTRCQGWGPLLGDEGGGDSIGLHCLKSVTRAEDGGRKTIMTELLLKELKLENAWDLIDWCYDDAKFTFGKFAALARVVLDAAKQGDDAAITILEQKAEAVVEAIRVLHGNLTHDDGKGIYASILLRKLRVVHPLAKIMFPSVDPAVAAANIALNARADKK